jgi:hypothetical protein
VATHAQQSLNRVAFSATVHCLTGCAIGEVLGMVIGTALGMEIVDNAIMLLIPGAMDAGLDDIGFYLALAAALLIAGVAAFPANRWLISRGKGHAVVHQHHAH